MGCRIQVEVMHDYRQLTDNLSRSIEMTQLISNGSCEYFVAMYDCLLNHSKDKA
jgi:hypothetical protein